MKKICVFILNLLWLGCVPHYQSKSEMPSDLQNDLQEVENYYIEQANKSAAFETSCSQDETEATILTTSKEEFIIKHETMWEKGAFLFDERIATIGVSACGTKLKYQVLCGVDEAYAAPVFQYPSSRSKKKGPCKVVQEGGVAHTAVSEENDAAAEKKKEEEEALKQARQRQEQQNK